MSLRSSGHRPKASSDVCSGTKSSWRGRTGTYFRGSDLSVANLAGANLSDMTHERRPLFADLGGANLTSVDGLGVILTSANLADADLRNARLRHAHLAGAYLTGANLAGTASLAPTSPKPTPSTAPALPPALSSPTPSPPAPTRQAPPSCRRKRLAHPDSAADPLRPSVVPVVGLRPGIELPAARELWSPRRRCTAVLTATGAGEHPPPLALKVAVSSRLGRRPSPTWRCGHGR